MSAMDRGIGSEGLEQGGPSLGNDYTRPSASQEHTPQTVILPRKDENAGGKEDGNLNMDRESSRNLSSGNTGMEDELEDDDLDLDDDEDMDDLDVDDEEDSDEENDII